MRIHLYEFFVAYIKSYVSDLYYLAPLNFSGTRSYVYMFILVGCKLIDHSKKSRRSAHT